MNSSATSDLLIKVKDLHLSFDAPLYKSWTLRDLFVDWVKKPLSALEDSQELHVLRGINLKIRKGDRIAILGKNGAGKTSLCRCISGIYSQSSGDVEVTGTLRAIFDTSMGIQPELTGFENLKLLSKFIYPLERGRHHDIIKDSAEFSGLGEYLHMPFKTYSNGMKARLCLSLVTALPADILILDEVFDGADISFRTRIVGRMTELIEKSGAVLFVSHSPDQIRQVCNKAIVLDQGVVSFFGDVEKAISIYKTLPEFGNPEGL
ncbi:MAG TPA: ATP-binding cassette domain-containing protein [Bdellovibrio sp.]|uniref:ABC transporter ATP-binding protein n=1 Tax=Bdellovibrio sp. TaxID=28201 RepID=UPI002F1DABBF